MARLCRRAGWPSQVQGRRKRVQAIGSTGSCSVAGVQVLPAVGRDIDAGDPPASGPGQAGDLREAWPGEASARPRGR